MAKLRTLPVHRRLSFAMALAYANERLAGHVVALANADIFFDHTLELVLRHRQTLLLDTVGCFHAVVRRAARVRKPYSEPHPNPPTRGRCWRCCVGM